MAPSPFWFARSRDHLLIGSVSIVPGPLPSFWLFICAMITAMTNGEPSRSLHLDTSFLTSVCSTSAPALTITHQYIINVSNPVRLYPPRPYTISITFLIGSYCWVENVLVVYRPRQSLDARYGCGYATGGFLGIGWMFGYRWLRFPTVVDTSRLQERLRFYSTLQYTSALQTSVLAPSKR